MTTQPSTNQQPLHRLDRLVGTWDVTGPTSSGRVRYEWADDALVQHIDLVSDGERTAGVEHIRYDAASDRLRSRYVGTDGETLDYVYDLSGDVLTIWFGDVGSPAHFTGTFSPDGDRNVGRWEWPGGGYESTMTRHTG